MKNIYGAIGYTIFENNNNKILILSDMHDTLPKCEDSIIITDWFKSKFDSSQILLEEVPHDKRSDSLKSEGSIVDRFLNAIVKILSYLGLRTDDNIELKELWASSLHTQELKKLYLLNPNIISAVDIRPFLIPFSLEIIMMGIEKNPIIFKDYLKNIDLFFSTKEDFILEKLQNYKINNLKHTKLGKHFILIKKNYFQFLVKYKKSINKNIIEIINTELINDMNDLLDNIMEWYVCAHIDLHKNKSIIIHVGLAHSEKIVDWLSNHYEYKMIDEFGINKMKDTNNKLKGCFPISYELDSQLGGKNKY
jgi:hypothetical protein